MLKSLPVPSQAHQDVLNDLVNDLVEKHGLSQPDIEKRKEVQSKLYDLIIPKFPGKALPSLDCYF